VSAVNGYELTTLHAKGTARSGLEIEKDLNRSPHAWFELNGAPNDVARSRFAGLIRPLRIAPLFSYLVGRDLGVF